MREDGKYGLEEVYGPLFKQAIAFCGQRWMSGETRRIELPFPGVDANVSAKLTCMSDDSTGGEPRSSRSG